MKKKFLSLALALALSLSLAVPVFAANETVTISLGDNKTLGTISNVYASVTTDTGIYHAKTYFCNSGAAVTMSESWGTDADGEALGPEWIGYWSKTVEGYKELSPGSSQDYTKIDGTQSTLPDGIFEFEFVYYDEPYGDASEVVYLIVGKTDLAAPGEVDPNPTVPDTTDPTTTTPSFTDVKSGDWYYDSVQWAVEQEITNGTTPTTFSPKQDCTVAHILTFLWRASGSPKPAGENPFGDVKPGDWFADAAAWAKENGMVSGDTFGPNAPCTRSMAVTYLWKAAGSPDAKAASFTDVPASADCAQAVNWAVEQGITDGTSAEKFSPDTVCTRGHIVTFLYRAFAE